ncbi:MAG: NAD-dependent epimerase/dehydratase family protein [Acidimicrobiales bacterium]
MPVRQVVLGAGPLGTAIASQLALDGLDVGLYGVMGNRAYNMPGTSPQEIDGASVDDLSEVCQGAAVVYLCLNAHYVDWPELFPSRLDAAIEAAARNDSALVYHDSVYVYGVVDGSFTEVLPLAATTRKGMLRARMAEVFLDALQSERVRGVIGRTADMYGAGALNSSFNSTLGERHFYPLLAGKSVSVAGNIDVPHTYGFVDDVARGLIKLGRTESAYGDVWHVPAAPTLTHRELLGLAFSARDLRPKIRGSSLSGFFIRAIGRFQADVGEVAEMMYMFERPFEVSHTKYEDAFGADVTPHDVALARTLDWYEQNPSE